MYKVHYMYGDQLSKYPALQESMFQDRSKHFIHRLGWSDLVENENGWEMDEFDTSNPIYIVVEMEDGSHGASMRLLPTTGPNLANTYFSYLIGGFEIRSPLIWECTRFLVSEYAHRNLSSALLIAAGEIMEHLGLEYFLAVFDRRMARYYSRLGAIPDILGESGEGKKWIGLGLWGIEDSLWEPALNHLGITRDDSRRWLESFLSKESRSSDTNAHGVHDIRKKFSSTRLAAR